MFFFSTSLVIIDNIFFTEFFHICCSGYLAPEYAMLGHLTEKTDVFAFGVVALEIVTGRPNSNSLGDERSYLLDWVLEFNSFL